MSITPKDRKQKLGRGAVAEVARRLGFTLGHVSEVNRGNRAHRKTAVALARKMGMKVEDAFPEYYRKQNGQPIGG